MKILYMMHVDWNWIKQRPQYLAEFLSQDNEVSVIYDKNYKRDKLCSNSQSDCFQISPFYRIPGEFSNKLIRYVNQIHRAVKILLTNNKFKSDIIWITYPTMITAIPPNYNGRIIYDCMDDYVAMASAEAKETILKFERITINKADTVFFSSNYLCNIICKRYGGCKKDYIIRNGFASSDFKNCNPCAVDNNMYNVCYLGTISSWMDWETLLYALKKIDKLVIHIIGPVNKLPQNINNARIIFHGSLDHIFLRDYVKEMGCFIMPFVINDVILAVDPVKLYEYISFKKNIISSYYPDIKRFSKFVNFYSSKEEFVNQIIKLIKTNNKITYNFDEAQQFLERNTWEARVKEINRIIDGNFDSSEKP